MAETMAQIGINLPAPMVAKLDEIGLAFGLSRSAVARVLITTRLATFNLRELGEIVSEQERPADPGPYDVFLAAKYTDDHKAGG